MFACTDNQHGGVGSLVDEHWGSVAPHGSCCESSRPFQSEDQLTGSSKHLICVGLWDTVKDNIIKHRSFVISHCDDGKV